MQGIARGPLGVTREAVDADKRQTGFQSRGKIMVEHSVRVIVPFQGVIQPPWRPVGWLATKGPSVRGQSVISRSAGNAGQRLNHVIAVPCNRVNPAATWQGVTS